MTAWPACQVADEQQVDVDLSRSITGMDGMILLRLPTNDYVGGHVQFEPPTWWY